MIAASQRMEYERAAELRDKLYSIQGLMERQHCHPDQGRGAGRAGRGHERAGRHGAAGPCARGGRMEGGDRFHPIPGQRRRRSRRRSLRPVPDPVLRRRASDPPATCWRRRLPEAGLPQLEAVAPGSARAARSPWPYPQARATSMELVTPGRQRTPQDALEQRNARAAIGQVHAYRLGACEGAGRGPAPAQRCPAASRATIFPTPRAS